MQANYHTHTYRCHHAYNCEWEYAEAAAAAGLRILGFSDHAPMPFGNGYCSKIRMAAGQLKDYIETVEGLRARYAGRLEIHCGLEAEYYPEVFPALLELLEEQPGIEYLLLALHFTDNEYGGAWRVVQPTDSEALLIKYVDQLIAGMETGRFLYVCHPDVAAFTGPNDVYRRHMKRLCQAAKELHMPLEINGQGLRSGWHYPSDRFFSIAGEVGCTAVLGTDAHRAANVCRPEEIARMEEMAERNGLRILETLSLKEEKR